MPSSDLAEYFCAQARWRESKAAEYPDDPRNSQSAEALYSVAEFVESGEADEWTPGITDALDAHLFEDLTLGGESTVRSVVRYGYGYNTGPTQHDEFLAELRALCVVDAFAAISEGSADAEQEDPTGSLHPFEVEAAKEGVYLPRRYWDRREKSLVSELEEVVDSYRDGTVPAREG